MRKKLGVKCMMEQRTNIRQKKSKIVPTNPSAWNVLQSGIGEMICVFGAIAS